MKVKKKTLKKNDRRIRRKKHIRKIIFGTQSFPRLSVFKSIKNIYIQAINDDEGHTIASLNSISVNFLEKNKSDMSYKLGQMFGVLLKEKGIKKASFDRNGFKYSGRISKLADGIRESGVYI